MINPTAIDLGDLFRDPDMFESRRDWERAGFRVVATSGKIMVARHPSVEGLLFKKYPSDVPQKDQLKNYERRAEGADRLRAFVGQRRLSRVAVPHKRILELPRAVSRRETSHVLVVEQLDLLGDEQTKTAYRRIEAGVLAELCVVLHRFRGMDSIAKNLPFTSDGRIALVDTEHWDRATTKPYLHRVGEHLSDARRKLAKKIFEQLEDGDDVRLSDFWDEDTSESSDDFEDEDSTSDSSDDFDFGGDEDTSSSSSSS